MFAISRNYLRIVSRWLWASLFTLIILSAVLIQLGRAAFPVLDDYQAEITDLLEQVLKVQVNVGRISATWSGLRPKIELADVNVYSSDDTEIFHVGKITAELSLVYSVWEWRLAWRKLRFDDFDATVDQQPNGQWMLRGLKSFPKNKSPKGQSANRLNADGLLDVFLLGRRIKLTQARFALNFNNSSQSQVLIPEINLENDQNFHRILASVDIDGAKTFRLVVEGRGDPRRKDFNSQGYIEFKDFPIAKVLSALDYPSLETASPDAQSLTSAPKEPVSLEPETKEQLNLKLWFSSSPGKEFDFKGAIHSGLPPIKVPKGLVLPESVQTKIAGKWREKDGWTLILRELYFVFKDDITTPALNIEGHFQPGVTPRLKVTDIDLADWTSAILATDVNEHLVGQLLTELDLKGQLSDISVDLVDKTQGYVNLRARLSKGASGAYKGAPAFTGVNGVVHASALGGSLFLEGREDFSFFLPKIYPQAMAFQRAKGRVSWELDLPNKMVYLSSGLLSVTTEQEAALGQFYLRLPFAKKYGSTLMTLQISSEKMPALSYKTYLPNVIPKPLYEWLGGSVLGGEVSNLRFLYHGSVDVQPEFAPMVQLYANVKDASLKFDPAWPEMEGIDGELWLDGKRLDIHVSKAQLHGNTIKRAHVYLQPSTKSTPLTLAVDASAEAQLNDVMALLQNSPLQTPLGKILDNWDTVGRATADLSLRVPLDKGEPEVQVVVNAVIEQAGLTMRDLDITLSEIDGDFHFDTEGGIDAKQLNATLWGERIQGRIQSIAWGAKSSQSALEPSIDIDFSGAIPMKALADWTKRPELLFMDGTTQVSGRIRLPQGGASNSETAIVDIVSDLGGVAINLPFPLNKSAEQPKNLSVNLRIFDDYQQMEVALGTQAHLLLHMDNRIEGGVFSGALGLNQKLNRQQWLNSLVGGEQAGSDLQQTLSKVSRFDITGTSTRLNLGAWLDTQTQYFEHEQALLGDDSPESQPFAVDLNLDIGYFEIGETSIEKIAISGGRDYLDWRFKVNSPMAAGEVLYYQSEHAEGVPDLILSLDYLRLMDDQVEVKPLASTKYDVPVEALVQSAVEDSLSSSLEESMLADTDIASFPELRFSTRQLFIKNEAYGDWSFDLDPVEGGIVINSIYATTRGVLVGADDQNGASFLWTKNALGEHRSYFQGTLRVDNLADAFEAWEQEKLLESKSADITLDLQWDGAPDQYTAAGFNGQIGLNIVQGSFFRGADSDENALLRLFSLFNFDTILRRLQFNFSDLASQGFAYDKITGSFNLEDGIILMEEPMIVESSSSYIQLTGTVDLINEKMDTEMVVTLPVASNIAMATALVAGLPAAIGVYVVGKLFKKQVDQAVSFNVEVKGSWDEPKTKIKKVKARKKKKRESKSQPESEVESEPKPQPPINET
ncbi:MAG: hypothetical protein COA42_03825 [Alteromonadaceae bacterium]|nr:MAG: hypothetical protein COA42_03825 [Alteromonadaceae bacterium]